MDPDVSRGLCKEREGCFGNRAAFCISSGILARGGDSGFVGRGCTMEEGLKEMEGSLGAETFGLREAYYESFLDSAQDAIIWSGADHRILRVNAAFSRLFWYRPDEVLGLTIDPLIAPEELLREASDITARVSEGESIRIETIRRRKDGSSVFVDLMVGPVRVGGRQVGVCASYRDITDRKRMDLALRTSHQALVTVLDSVDATIYVADMSNHEILFANKCMKDYFGRDLLGEVCWKAFRAADAPCEHCTNKQLLNQDGEPEGIVIWEGQNPVTGRWFMNHDRAVRWLDGRMVHLQVATDITARKEAEHALRREKEYLAALHETSLGLISRLDPQELLQTILTRAAGLVGIQNGYIYLYDAEADELVLEVALGRYKPLLKYRIRSGYGLSGKIFQTQKPMLVEDYSTWPGRLPHPGFDGLRSAVGVPLKTGTRVAGIMGLGSFDMEYRLGEAELGILSRFAELSSIALDNAYLHARLRDELNHREKSEAERARMESQLLRAQKLEAVGTLAAGLAHDFNNLLMGVQGNASLMLSELKGEHPHRERLRSIEEYVRRGAELTGQLLGFARGGKAQVQATDLNELVRSSATLFIRTKKEINLQAELQEGLWSAQVDRGQLSQALLNLFINAWQAMPGGGVLRVSTENIEVGQEMAQTLSLSPGRYVRLSVSDTGVGMDEKTKNRVFEPFFTTKKMGKGTGLGLSVVYGIIRSHGGAIDMESEIGEGSTFRIYLPASEAKSLPAAAEHPPETLKGSGTILLVDDEEMILQVAGEILEKIGYRVLPVESGKKAVELFRNSAHSIDLVILDMIMPEMSGTEVFQRIQEIDPAARVLLSSGYSVEGQARELLKRGCKGFIQKPYSMGELSRKIRQVLET